MLTFISTIFKELIKNSYKRGFDTPENNYTFDFQKTEITLMSVSSIEKKIEDMISSNKRIKALMPKKLKNAAWHEWLIDKTNETISFACKELLKRKRLEKDDK